MVTYLELLLAVTATLITFNGRYDQRDILENKSQVPIKSIVPRYFVVEGFNMDSHILVAELRRDR